MKRRVSIALIVVAGAVAVSAVAHSLEVSRKRDWTQDKANMTASLHDMLKYNPTDGASHEGKVRKAVRPASEES